MTKRRGRHALNQSELAILGLLRANGGSLDISIARLAGACGCTECTVRRAVGRLEGLGLLLRRDNWRPDGGQREATWSLTDLARRTYPWDKLDLQEKAGGGCAVQVIFMVNDRKLARFDALAERMGVTRSELIRRSIELTTDTEGNLLGSSRD